MLPWPLKYSENQRSLFERKAVILSKIFVMCSHEGAIPRGDSEFFLCPTLMTR